MYTIIIVHSKISTYKYSAMYCTVLELVLDYMCIIVLYCTGLSIVLLLLIGFYCPLHEQCTVCTRTGKKVRRFKPSFVCCAFEAKFEALLLSTLMFAHADLYNLNVWLNCGSRNVDAVLLPASVSFLSPVMLNPSRNSDRKKTSTRYKAIIQFCRLSIAIQGKSNIDKNTCKPSKLFLTNFQIKY